MDKKPLVVDLDGTLIATDTLHESVVRIVRVNPLEALCLPWFFAKGRAFLKQRLATKTVFDPETLPYHETLIAWLKQKRMEGRRLILCTGADQLVAHRIAGYLGIFDEVIASNGHLNMAGKNKANALVQRFGHQGYDYAGNARQDLPVWSHARRGIIVNGSRRLLDRAHAITTVERIFPRRRIGFSGWRRTLHIHPWLKNLFIFVSLPAHDWRNRAAWASLIVAFTAFSLCASSVYVAQDLLDLESDRHHPHKRQKPFATGLVPVWLGALLAPLLMAIALTVATLAGKTLLDWMMFYFALTCAWSWELKKYPVIDCFGLALLYTLPVVAGAHVLATPPSFWLLAFCMFVFLSLAFVKRYTELNALAKGSRPLKVRRHGHGYLASDAPLIQIMGMVSGYLSVLVLAFYLNSDQTGPFYAAPRLLWGALLVCLFWINWIWMQAHRGHIHDDPFVFIIRDRVSLASGALFAIFFLTSVTGVSWPP